MSKGKAIRSHIEQGASDEQILTRVDTTLNSIRWHRSKMRSPAETKPSAARRTVGEALYGFGLAEEARTAIFRLAPERATELYDDLAQWTFVTNDRTTARFGQCRYRTQTIEVHGTLVDKPTDLRRTFFHELAHALDALINGKSSAHGAPWQAIMSKGFLLSPIRCGGHTAEASEALRQVRATRAVETWTCGRCGFDAPIARKRKHPPHRYKHSRCGGSFKLKDA